MASVNRLLLEVAELEDGTRELIDGNRDRKQAVRVGYSLAQTVMLQTVVELSVKGIIPEGAGSKLVTELAAALEQSKERVTQ